jgi:hypothetical protein
MKKILFIMVMLFCGLLSTLNAYQLSTTDVTAYLHNAELSSLEGWHPFSTEPLSNVSVVTCFGETGILLASHYSSSTISAAAGIRLYSDSTDYYPVNLIDANTTGIVRDALIVKIHFTGTPYSSASARQGWITGNIGVRLQGGLSCSTDANHPAPSYMTDTCTYEMSGFLVSTTQPYWGKTTNWTELSFTFIPQGQCDWWQIRNLEVFYAALPNQPYESGIVINKVEMYAIRVDAW